MDYASVHVYAPGVHSETFEQYGISDRGGTASLPYYTVPVISGCNCERYH